MAAELPPLPQANEDGHNPAIEHARDSLERKSIWDGSARNTK